ncbi:MAG: hypothetical protein WA432_04575 [Candidatus Babeliaceae bacterium]
MNLQILKKNILPLEKDTIKGFILLNQVDRDKHTNIERDSFAVKCTTILNPSYAGEENIAENILDTFFEKSDNDNTKKFNVSSMTKSVDNQITTIKTTIDHTESELPEIANKKYCDLSDLRDKILFKVQKEKEGNPEGHTFVIGENIKCFHFDTHTNCLSLMTNDEYNKRAQEFIENKNKPKTSVLSQFIKEHNLQENK